MKPQFGPYIGKICLEYGSKGKIEYSLQTELQLKS